MNKISFLLIITIFILTSCFSPNNNDNIGESILSFYLTDSPNENIQEAKLNIKEIKFTSDSTEIELLTNQSEDFLQLAGYLKKIKEISVYDTLKNAKINITLDSTIDIGSKTLSVESTKFILELDTSEFNLNRKYDVIIDLDLGLSLTGDTNFNPYFKTWMVANSSADYVNISGYIYDNSITQTPKKNRTVLITDTNYSTILYSTISNEDGKYEFNKLKLDLTNEYKIAVAYAGVNIEHNLENFEPYIITDSATNLDINNEEINLYIGEGQ
ncbi:hypothetical protein JCM30566_14260 [Marinitoga arctica]